MQTVWIVAPLCITNFIYLCFVHALIYSRHFLFYECCSVECTGLLQPQLLSRLNPDRIQFGVCTLGPIPNRHGYMTE